MSGKVVRLVPASVSQDTIEALEELLRAARVGDVIGLAYVAMHKVNDYTLDIAGECKRTPTLTRVMLSDLDDAVRDFAGKRIS